MRGLIGIMAGCLVWQVGAADAQERSALASEMFDLFWQEFQRPATTPFPASNPYTVQKAALGKQLFFDPRLSGAANMSCATCHNPSFGWENGQALGIGAEAARLDRHVPTVLSMAFLTDAYFWDGRAPTLEEQAKGPITNPVEMDMRFEDLIPLLAQVDGYARAFEAAFPGEGVTEDTVVKALATYQRTIVPTYAPFDAWIDGDAEALTVAEQRGFDLFVGKANCVACHSGWNLSDNLFHDIGLPTGDLGRARVADDTDATRFAFKTPGLRNIVERAPYMHTGAFATLDEVVGHYNDGFVDRPSLSPEIFALNLTDREQAELVAFLRTLSGETEIVALPQLPN